MTTDQTDDRLVPDGPGVVDIYDQTAALHLAVVDRAAAPTLDETWEVPGTYLLLEPVTEDGAWSAYVGKAPAGLRQRLMGHVRKTEKWVRAVLIQRDTTHGFNSTHTAWLEGRLYDLVTASASGTLSNSQRPGDDTLAPYDRQMLATTIDPIRRVLRLIGCVSDLPTTLPGLLNAGVLSVEPFRCRSRGPRMPSLSLPCGRAPRHPRPIPRNAGVCVQHRIRRVAVLVDTPPNTAWRRCGHRLGAAGGTP